MPEANRYSAKNGEELSPEETLQICSQRTSDTVQSCLNLNEVFIKSICSVEWEQQMAGIDANEIIVDILQVKESRISFSI